MDTVEFLRVERHLDRFVDSDFSCHAASDHHAIPSFSSNDQTGFYPRLVAVVGEVHLTLTA